MKWNQDFKIPNDTFINNITNIENLKEEIDVFKKEFLCEPMVLEPDLELETAQQRVNDAFDALYDSKFYYIRPTRLEREYHSAQRDLTALKMSRNLYGTPKEFLKRVRENIEHAPEGSLGAHIRERQQNEML